MSVLSDVLNDVLSDVMGYGVGGSDPVLNDVVDDVLNDILWYDSQQGSAPINLVPPVLSGVTTSLPSTLDVTQGVWDENGGGPYLVEYRWYRDGVYVPGLEFSSKCPLLASDLGKTIFCRVLATNSGGSATADSNSLTIWFTPINSVAPAISGSVNTVGQTLTATTGTWIYATNYTYQWKRNGVAIAGATSSTYVTQNADFQTSLTCDVTGSNGGESTTVSSNTLTTQFLPVNSSSPIVSGGTATGSALSSTSGSWLFVTSALTYQWTRDNVDIPGATGTSYVTVEGDVGTGIRCKVTGTNSQGSVTATSNSITVTQGATIRTLKSLFGFPTESILKG